MLPKFQKNTKRKFVFDSVFKSRLFAWKSSGNVYTHNTYTIRVCNKVERTFHDSPGQRKHPVFKVFGRPQTTTTTNTKIKNKWKRTIKWKEIKRNEMKWKERHPIRQALLVLATVADTDSAASYCCYRSAIISLCKCAG